MREKVCYLDNAATTWPKPPEVVEAVRHALTAEMGSPGRGSHRMALCASKLVYATRVKIAQRIHASRETDIVFTANATQALNLALFGAIGAGDHVLSTAMEHNAVRRPLEWLRHHRQVEVSYIAYNPHCLFEAVAWEREIRPHTRWMVVNHASNVLGSIMPLAEIAAFARKHQLKMIVDTAQTLGTVEVDVRKWGIDLLAFAGHKSLYGPQGTGGLYVAPHIELTPFIHGGTGGASLEMQQPRTRPEGYEAGTLNVPGIAGLHAALQWMEEKSCEQTKDDEWQLTQLAIDQLQRLPRVQVLGPALGEPRTGLVSFYVDGMDSAHIAYRLDRQYNIAVRAGLHCAPAAHEAVHTLDTGAVRWSVGVYNDESDIAYAIRALQEILTTD